MALFDNWSQLVIKVLTSESALVAELLHHAVELGSTREELIRGILERFVPSIYEIGTGQIVDSVGTYSKQIDVVIARRDVPRLLLPSGAKVFLVESVVAAIEVKTELNSKTLREALDNCASVRNLKVRIDDADEFAKAHGLTKTEEGDFKHEDEFKMLRLDSLYLPATYVIGFKGYASHLRDFEKTLQTWGSEKMKGEGQFALTWFPCVIAASGVFAVRNADIHEAPERYLCLLGKNECPMAVFVRHLLYRLAVKIPTTKDRFGVRPSYDKYFTDMQKIECKKGLFHFDESRNDQ